MKDEKERREKRYENLKKRTKKFALRVIKLYAALPKDTISQVIGNQLLRSGTSVGAHYREGLRARSNAEFISKIEVALQELEESIYWMELIVESGIFPEVKMKNILEEANELTAIFVTIVKKTKEYKK